MFFGKKILLILPFKGNSVLEANQNKINTIKSYKIKPPAIKTYMTDYTYQPAFEIKAYL